MPGRGRERVAVGGLALLLVVTRLRFVTVFGARWTDEDQSLLWFAASDLLGGHVREPYFFGQPYGSWLEALLAVPLLVVGVGYRWALPLASTVLGTVPWLLFAAVAWWGRRSAALAALVLVAGLALSVEGVAVAAMPRGLLPGVVLGCVAACVVLAWPASPPSWAVGGFGLLFVVAASLNVGSGLVTGPVAVFLGCSLLVGRRWGALVALAAGLAVGGAGHVAAQSFYASRPLYDLHPSPTFSFSFDRLVRNAGEADRYLAAYAPELWRWWGWPVVALIATALWVVWRHRSLAAVGAAVAAVVVAVAVLGTSKADDGVASLFFPWSRVYLALPWSVVALALLPPPSDRRPTRWTSVALGLAVVVGLSSMTVREVRAADRVEQLVAAAEGVAPVVPVATDDLARRCDLRRQAVARHAVDVVVDRYDRTAAYGCGALLADDGITTVFPEYDRRTWLVLELRRRVVDRLLVSGLDACPTTVETCREVDADERLFLVTGDPRPLTAWLDLLDLTMRRGWTE